MDKINTKKFLCNLEIKGTPYKVYQVNDELINLMGSTNLKDKIILISDSLSEEDITKTIIHELLHAYFHECSLFNYCKDEILITWLDDNFERIIDEAYTIFNKGVVCNE